MSTRPGSLPPRHSLPRDVVLPVLPGLGLTWYDRRGAGYCARRAGMSFLWAALTALVTLITVAVLIAYHNRSLAGFYAVLGIELAYSLGMLAFFAVGTVRRWNDPGAAGQLFGRPRAGVPGEAGAGLRRRPFHKLGQLILGIGFLSIGLYLAFLLVSLLPETPVERQARLRVAAELRARGHITPGP